MVAIPDDTLTDPLLRLEVSSLLEGLERQGVQIEPGAKQLIEGGRHGDG